MNTEHTEDHKIPAWMKIMWVVSLAAIAGYILTNLSKPPF